MSIERSARRRTIARFGWGGTAIGFASIPIAFITQDVWMAFSVWCVAYVAINIALVGIILENSRVD